MACPTCGSESGCSHVRACPKCQTENPGSNSACEACGVDMDRVLRFEESLARGRDLAAREEYDDAIPFLEVAVAAYPKNPEAGPLLQKSRQKSKVVRQCRERIAANPDDADAILGILQVLPDDGPARQAALELLPRLKVTDILKALDLARVLPEGEARRIAEELADRKSRYDQAVAAAQKSLAAGEVEQARKLLDPILSESPYPPAIEVKRMAEDRGRRRDAPADGSTVTSPSRRILIVILAAAFVGAAALLVWKIWGYTPRG